MGWPACQHGCKWTEVGTSKAFSVDLVEKHHPCNTLWTCSEVLNICAGEIPVESGENVENCMSHLFKTVALLTQIKHRHETRLIVTLHVWNLMLSATVQLNDCRIEVHTSEDVTKLSKTMGTICKLLKSNFTRHQNRWKLVSRLLQADLFQNGCKPKWCLIWQVIATLGISSEDEVGRRHLKNAGSGTWHANGRSTPCTEFKLGPTTSESKSCGISSKDSTESCDTGTWSSEVKGMCDDCGLVKSKPTCSSKFVTWLQSFKKLALTSQSTSTGWGSGSKASKVEFPLQKLAAGVCWLLVTELLLSKLRLSKELVQNEDPNILHHLRSPIQLHWY